MTKETVILFDDPQVNGRDNEDDQNEDIFHRSFQNLLDMNEDLIHGICETQTSKLLKNSIKLHAILHRNLMEMARYTDAIFGVYQDERYDPVAGGVIDDAIKAEIDAEHQRLQRDRFQSIQERIIKEEQMKLNVSTPKIPPPSATVPPVPVSTRPFLPPPFRAIAPSSGSLTIPVFPLAKEKTTKPEVKPIIEDLPVVIRKPKGHYSRWQKDEIERFKLAYATYGPEDVERITRYVGSKQEAQIRSKIRLYKKSLTLANSSKKT